jgi:succinate dehydrogenase / fumarate reductase cytochrome b subunit
MRVRPLSPHLSVYRFAYTMALSITHRISGVFMATGLIVLACWLMAAAGGAAQYAATVAVLSHWCFLLLLGGWLLAFLFHFANGIRHLFWDSGFGLEKAQARRSAAVVIIAVALVFAWCLWLLYSRHGGAA